MTIHVRTPDPKGYFSFNDKTTRYVLAFNSILWIQAVRGYTIIHLKETKKTYIVCQNLGSLESEFLRSGFCKIHRSYLVNMNEVVTYHQKKVLLTDDTKLEVAVRERPFFLKAYCEIKHLPLRRRSRSVRRVG